jgi:hypothetical protein
MDIKFKAISDMVRIENGKPYNIQGYSTPILVFCSD